MPDPNAQCVLMSVRGGEPGQTVLVWYVFVTRAERWRPLSCEYHLEEQNKTWQNINIATGTTDPETDSVTWTKFSDYKAWSADGATCISYKFDHQMAPLALVPNLATKWQNMLSRLSHLHCHIALDCPIAIITKWHNLHWSPGCITALPHCLELPY